MCESLACGGVRCSSHSKQAYDTAEAAYREKYGPDAPRLCLLIAVEASSEAEPPSPVEDLLPGRTPIELGSESRNPLNDRQVIIFDEGGAIFEHEEPLAYYETHIPEQLTELCSGEGDMRLFHDRGIEAIEQVLCDRTGLSDVQVVNNYSEPGFLIVADFTADPARGVEGGWEQMAPLASVLGGHSRTGRPWLAGILSAAASMLCKERGVAVPARSRGHLTLLR